MTTESTSITSWLQVNQYPAFDTILYLNGIINTSDCGRLSFFELTNIFDKLQHETITDKVRFERDITALHMQYRKYHYKSIQNTMKQIEYKPIQSTISTPNMNQTTTTNWSPITNITSTKNETTSKHQIVRIKLNQSPKKSNPLRLVGDHSWKWLKKTERKPVRKANNCSSSQYVIRNPSKYHLFQRIKRKYIWIYKSLIISYLDAKKLKMPSKYVYDSLYTNHDDIRYDSNKYKVEINIFIPISTKLKRYKSDGFDNNQLLAEYNAFYNLFMKLVKTREIDEKVMTKLIAEYPFELEIGSLNIWWFQGCASPRRMTLDFFYDINHYTNYYDEDKAIYCYNINRDFDDEFKRYNLSLREKQMLWYHAVSYLYDIKHWIKYRMKDLLSFLMSTYFSRREFFENVSRFGISPTLKCMAIQHK